MPLSISDSHGHVAWGVVVEVVEDLVLFVDGVKEVVEELDLFGLILKEFNDLVTIVEVWLWDLAGEVGGCLEADVALEVDKICKEFVDLSEAIPTIKSIDREGSSGEGSNGGLVHGDDIEGGGHGVGVVVVVAAGKACDWCRTGF